MNMLKFFMNLLLKNKIKWKNKDLGGNKMDKEWYKSKTVWAGVIIALYGIFSGQLEPYKEIIISIASGLGIVGIRAALPKK